MISVSGGRGGAGASSTALALTRQLASRDPGGVVLIDGDPDHPNLDLTLGAVSGGADLWPSARLDHVLLRLGDLASDGSGLDGLLWSDENASFHALLAPAQLPVAAGPEHLDFLLQFQLAPRFDVVVVDLGSPGWEPPASTRFWMAASHWVLIVAKGTAADTRPALELRRRTGELPGTRRCGVVLTQPQPTEEAALRAQLRGQVDGIWTVPDVWRTSAHGSSGRPRWPRRAPDSRVGISAVVAALLSDSGRWAR